MNTKIDKPRVAIAGLSLELYSQALPGYVERLQAQFSRFQEPLEAFADVRLQAVCFLRDQLASLIRKAEAEDLDALVLVPLSYTASSMALPPLLETKLPLVIWNTQEASEITDSYGMDDLLMNHVTQGTQDVTNVLRRACRVFGMESGHYRDAKALGRLADWLNAARAKRYARQMRVGLLGWPFQDMGDFGIDETMLAAKWGPHVIHLGVSSLIDAAASADPREIRSLVEEDRRTYEISPELTEEVHLCSARQELALRHLVRKFSLDALTINYMSLKEDSRLQTLPFLGLNKLIAEGMGYAGEGNVTTAAHMAQMRQLCGHANFTEIYTLDYRKNRMMMTHMQECNSALARRDCRVRLIRKEFFDPRVAPYAGMHFTLEPGPVTLTAVTTDNRGDFYYIAYEAAILGIDPLETFDAPHWIVQLDEPVEDFLTRYSMAGGPHHLVSIPGRRTGALEKLAKLQQFGFISLSQTESRQAPCRA